MKFNVKEVYMTSLFMLKGTNIIVNSNHYSVVHNRY